MATLPTGYVVTTTGDYSTNVELIGGVIANTTSATTVGAGNPLTRAFTLAQTVASGINYQRSVPKALSGAAHAYSAQTATGGGTFAYNAPATNWLIRTLGDPVNGSASNVLLFNGNEEHRSRTLISNSQKGAQTSSAHRSGYWRGIGISGQRTNWSTPPSTNNVTYRLPTNNAVDAADQAQFVTYKSVPGELTYHYGSGATPTTDEYAARTL